VRVNRKPPIYANIGQLSVPDGGKNYLVTERPGYCKANLNGAGGWASVWASTPYELGWRIARALRGLQ
jgi:hypothetical protein